MMKIRRERNEKEHENNGISAEIALNEDLVDELAGKTIYLSYDYSQIELDR